MVKLSQAEHLLPFLEQLIPNNCKWVSRKCHCIETLWRACPLPVHGWVPKSLPLSPFQRYHWLFFFSFFFSLTGSLWGEQCGWPQGTRQHPHCLRFLSTSGVTRFIPADPSLLPRMPFTRNRRRVLWGAKLWLVLCPKRTFFTNNYHIIINPRERHDVKMKLLKTFLDSHLALYKLTDNPIRHSSRLWVWAKLENCCHYIVIINTL